MFSDHFPFKFSEPTIYEKHKAQKNVLSSNKIPYPLASISAPECAVRPDASSPVRAVEKKKKKTQRLKHWNQGRVFWFQFLGRQISEIVHCDLPGRSVLQKLNRAITPRALAGLEA